jgi:hypothetical protein
VTQNPTAEWIARQLSEAFPWKQENIAPLRLQADSGIHTKAQLAIAQPDQTAALEAENTALLFLHARQRRSTLPEQ